jgi:uncharacterized protein
VGRIDMEQLVARAFYQPGDGIEAHLSSDTYAIVKKEGEALGLPIEVLRSQRPWFLSLLLPAMALQKEGYDPNLGIDKFFATKAQGKKKILELESFDYQINLLSTLSEKEEALLLLYTLKDLEALTPQVEKVVRAWRNGDERAIERLMTQPLAQDRAFYPIYDKILLTRNREMAAKVEGYLKSEGVYFVVVGAAHLAGDKGILRLLRDKGYSTQQL